MDQIGFLFWAMGWCFWLIGASLALVACNVVVLVLPTLANFLHWRARQIEHHIAITQGMEERHMKSWRANNPTPKSAFP